MRAVVRVVAPEDIVVPVHEVEGFGVGVHEFDEEEVEDAFFEVEIAEKAADCAGLGEGSGYASVGFWVDFVGECEGWGGMELRLGGVGGWYFCCLLRGGRGGLGWRTD